MKINYDILKVRCNCRLNEICLAFVFCSIGISTHLLSQNLISNSSFEDTVFVANPTVDELEAVKDWSTLSIIPNYFCWPYNHTIEPYSGNCYVGFGLFMPAEWVVTHGIKQELTTPLIPGKNYYLRFQSYKEQLQGGSCAFIEVFGLTKGIESLQGSDHYVGDQPEAIYLGESENFKEKEWTLIELCFTPEERLTHLAFSTNKLANCISYFYIDDVELYELGEKKFLPEELSLCDNEPIILGTELSTGPLIWNDGTISSFLEVNEPGLYWADAEICGLEILDSVLVLDHRIGLKSGFLGPDTTICFDRPFSLGLNQRIDGVTLQWNNGMIEPSIEPLKTDVYSLTVRKGNCFIQDSAVISLINCDPCKLFVPNVFSPNNDGVNDELNIFSNCNLSAFAIRLFDRWGNLAYRSNDLLQTWAGITLSGDLATSGVYVYVIEYEAEESGGANRKEITGDVLLLR